MENQSKTNGGNKTHTTRLMSYLIYFSLKQWLISLIIQQYINELNSHSWEQALKYKDLTFNRDHS